MFCRQQDLWTSHAKTLIKNIFLSVIIWKHLVISNHICLIFYLPLAYSQIILAINWTSLKDRNLSELLQLHENVILLMEPSRDIAGFIAVREDLENWKKDGYFKKVRECLEKSWKTEWEDAKWGKSQGF